MQGIRRPVFIAVCLLLCMAAARDGRAGTFCVAGYGMPPQCHYEDVKSCIDATDSPNTFCTVNPDAGLTFHGSQRYCTVDSGRVAQCLYPERSGCSTAAGTSAVCVDRSQTADDISPYRYDNRILN